MSSVTANIAKGMSRSSNKDKARMLNIAFSFAIEVLNFLILNLDLELISEEKYLTLRSKIEYLTNQLVSLHKKVNE